MRIKENYVMREVAGEYVVVPLYEEADVLHGVIKLTETGAFLWNLLAADQTEETLLKAILDEYNVGTEKAAQDIKAYLSSLKEIGCLEE